MNNRKYYLSRIIGGSLFLLVIVVDVVLNILNEDSKEFGSIGNVILLVLGGFFSWMIFKDQTIKGFQLMVGEKKYALGTVVTSIRKSGAKSGPYVLAEYTFKVDGENYNSDVSFKYRNKGDEEKYLQQQYIVVFLKNNPSNCDIIEKISVKDFNLQQPPEGWVDRNQIPITPEVLKKQSEDYKEPLSEVFGKKYREENAELYNPNKHIGWAKQEYIEKEKVKFEWEKAKEIRYSFPNGRIIYASINAMGMVAVPPLEDNCETEVIRIHLYNKKM